MTTKTASKPASKKSSPKAAPKVEPKKAPPAPKAKGSAPLLGEHPTPAAKVEPKPTAPAPEAKKVVVTSAPVLPIKKGERAKGAEVTKAPKSEREVISGDLKITVLAKANPRRAGSLAARTFALYKTGQTVAEWREAVKAHDADAGYLHFDIKRGHISVK